MKTALLILALILTACATPRQTEYTTYTGYAVDSLGNYDYSDSILIRIPKKKQ